MFDYPTHKDFGSGEGDLFQVDDGWECYVGDWLKPDSDKFPNGMKSVADKIHDSGFLAGLWLAPFVCETNSELLRNHPDYPSTSHNH